VSQLTKLAEDLEKIEFTSDQDIRLYVRTLHRFSQELYLRIGMDAEVLQAILSQYKGRWYHFGAGSKIKARLVAAHLRVGAEGAKLLGVSAVKMHASFRKHFVEPEMRAKNGGHRRRGDTFRISDQADGTGPVRGVA
jgi:hypothetical protein